MRNEYAGGIYVVAATKDGKTEYWAAAVPRERVFDELRLQAAPGWALTLTGKRLTALRGLAQKAFP